MSAVWVAMVAVNSGLLLAACYGWVCGRPKPAMRPEVADDQVLSLRGAA